MMNREDAVLAIAALVLVATIIPKMPNNPDYFGLVGYLFSYAVIMAVVYHKVIIKWYNEKLQQISN